MNASQWFYLLSGFGAPVLTALLIWWGIKVSDRKAKERDRRLSATETAIQQAQFRRGDF
jgi:hypothetical protein